MLLEKLEFPKDKHFGKLDETSPSRQTPLLQSYAISLKMNIFAKKNTVQRAALYFIIVTAVSLILNYFISEGTSLYITVYHSAAFGLAWASAYLLDNENLALGKKLGYSLLIMAVIFAFGAVLFTAEEAAAAIMKFSIVFVLYYLIASLRRTKSLRK